MVRALFTGKNTVMRTLAGDMELQRWRTVTLALSAPPGRKHTGPNREDWQIIPLNSLINNRLRHVPEVELNPGSAFAEF
jgi:hypothetical protein